MSGPYVGPVADLVNPYFDCDNKIKGGTAVNPGCEYVVWWLENHPGRWALVGENGVGLGRGAMTTLGYEYYRRKPYGQIERIYARKPHPQGETLDQSLERRPPKWIELPVPKPDFDWTKEELEVAVRRGMELLFPLTRHRRCG